jgi:hypothetical protein
MGIYDIRKKNADQCEKKKRTYRREASTRGLGLERRLVHAQRMERRLTGWNRRGSSEVVRRSDVDAGAVEVVSIVQTLMGWLRRE